MMKIFFLLLLVQQGLCSTLRTSRVDSSIEAGKVESTNTTETFTNATMTTELKQGASTSTSEETSGAMDQKDTTATKEDGSDSLLKLFWPWDLTANPAKTTANISWYGTKDQKYKICWKKSNEIKHICQVNSKEIWANGDNWSSGYVNEPIGGLECDTEYTLKVRRWLFSSDRIKFHTDPCGCANPCPYGGYYDGANCQIGMAPSGSTAFIWSNSYYYSSLASNSCPYPGSWYDGANCYVQPVPSGASGFIWANHWYYMACP